MKMKKFFMYFVCLFFTLSLVSCYEAYATSDTVLTDEQYVLSDNVDIDVVITYGTPYYWNGYLSYYHYRGLYYYYMYYDGYWYWRAYHRPFADGYFPHWTPRHHDRRFLPGKYGFGRPTSKYHGRPSKPHQPSHMDRRMPFRERSRIMDNRNRSNTHNNRVISPSNRPSRTVAPRTRNGRDIVPNRSTNRSTMTPRSNPNRIMSAPRSSTRGSASPRGRR